MLTFEIVYWIHNIINLSAIDEAVTFLEMRRGARLGYAIALGIDTKFYYKTKCKGVRKRLKKGLKEW